MNTNNRHGLDRDMNSLIDAYQEDNIDMFSNEG